MSSVDLLALTFSWRFLRFVLVGCLLLIDLATPINLLIGSPPISICFSFPPINSAFGSLPINNRFWFSANQCPFLGFPPIRHSRRIITVLPVTKRKTRASLVAWTSMRKILVFYWSECIYWHTHDNSTNDQTFTASLLIESLGSG